MPLDDEDAPDVTRANASPLKPSFSNLFVLLGLPQVGVFYAGRTFAAIGIWMEQLATGWLVWEMTQSGTWLGIVAFMRLAPSLLLGPIGGVMADRMWPLTLMRLCKAGVVAGLGLLTACFAFDILSIELLCLIVLAIGSLQAFANPANKAFVWYLVPKRWLPVAIPVGSITFNLAAFVGPAIAGALIAWQGVLSAFLVAFLLQAGFLLVLLRTHITFSPGDNRRIQGAGAVTVRRSLIDGAHYVRHDGAVRSVLALHLLFAVCGRPLIPLMPAVAVALLAGDAQTVGWLTASMGAGAVLGGVWLASRSRVQGLARLLLMFMLALMALVALLAAASSPLVAFAILFGIGACMIVRASGTQTLLQFAVDDAMRGRVMGYYNLFLKGGSAVGALAIGALSDLTTLPTALVIAALLGALGLALMGRSFLAAGRRVEAKSI